MSTPLFNQPKRQDLDVQDGLDRLMGERALYLQILQRFVLDHRDSADRIGALLTQGQADAAQMASHSLKGSAGLIGAQRVHDHAVLLENTIAAGADCAPLLPQLAHVLRCACHDIDRLLERDQDNGGELRPPAVSTDSLRALLAELKLLLREGDGAAIDLVEKSAPVLAAALGVPTYQMVAAAAHAFDFDTALDALELAQ